MPFGRLDSSASPHAPMSDINVTPLVDVMLVLLVIFIITAPLMAGALRLDLPRAEGTQPAAAAPAAVQLAIDAEGHILLDGQPVNDDAALSARLAQVAARSPDTELQLSADARLPYGRAIAIIGLAQQAGLSRIGFVAEAVPRAADPARRR
ncbi:MAG: biopolymer transporter ExbD [Burkholderiales bacterium]|jgi:biopolymer transport protein TolR|nr:biopolymer transporter ExbD [Burkholderiales bacterium]